jgi:predicted sulfurtransferase
VKPSTRCFSDLPSWIDDNLPALEGKQVLMYCTGGVRCERASAYLREKGPAFANVAQLKGAVPVRVLGCCMHCDPQ